MVNESYTAYCKLMRELLRKRADAGGALPLDEESNFVAQLDLYWHRMTEEQRVAVEQEFSEPVPETA